MPRPTTHPDRPRRRRRPTRNPPRRARRRSSPPSHRRTRITTAQNPIPQDKRLASKAPRLKKEQGAIDSNRPAQEIKNQIRGLSPWPRAYTFLHRPNAAPLRLNIDQVAITPTRRGRRGDRAIPSRLNPRIQNPPPNRHRRPPPRSPHPPTRRQTLNDRHRFPPRLPPHRRRSLRSRIIRPYTAWSLQRPGTAYGYPWLSNQGGAAARRAEQALLRTPAKDGNRAIPPSPTTPPPPGSGTSAL